MVYGDKRFLHLIQFPLFEKVDSHTEKPMYKLVKKWMGIKSLHV